MTNVSEAVWPARIHYVCTAGAASIVNLSPIVQAGVDRIAGLTILCGIVDPRQPSAPEQRNAIWPAERLANYVRDQLGLVATRIEVVKRDPNSHVVWCDVLSSVDARARADDATVVFNISSGLRSPAWGAILGCDPAVRARMKLVSVAQSDRRCTELGFDNAGRLVSEGILPADDRIGFECYLGAYGTSEVGLRQRAAHEAFLERALPVAERMLKTVKNGAWGGLAALQGWASRQDGQSVPMPVRLHIADLKEKTRRGAEHLANALHGLEGITIERNSQHKPRSIQLTTREGLRFLGGVWMEAIIRDRVLRQIGNRPGVEIHAGVQLALESPDRPQRADPVVDMELDLVVMVEDQPHLIEVKAVQQPTKLGDALARLVRKKAQLSGQQSRAWIVAPLLLPRLLDRGDLVERANASGVTLLAGRDALALLERDLASLVASPRSS